MVNGNGDSFPGGQLEINAYNTHTSPKVLRCLLPASATAQHTSHLCVSLLALWDLLNNLIDRNFKKRFIYFIYRSTLYETHQKRASIPLQMVVNHHVVDGN